MVAFFERAGARHHEDEELSLFPRLRAVAHLAPLLATLEEEHRLHESVYAELSKLVQGFGDEGPEAADERRLHALAKQLADVYRAHILREEEELFPAARASLAANVLEEVAKEMSARRPDRGRHARA